METLSLKIEVKQNIICSSLLDLGFEVNIDVIKKITVHVL